MIVHRLYCVVIKDYKVKNYESKKSSIKKILKLKIIKKKLKRYNEELVAIKEAP